jgi:hypothetical protein
MRRNTVREYTEMARATIQKRKVRGGQKGEQLRKRPTRTVR